MAIRSWITQVAESIFFDASVSDDITADNVQDAIVDAAENAQSALDTPIFTIVLQHNGTVSNGTFFGYDSLLPGDDTPILIPRDCQFTGFTFSNNRTNADYTLNFRKNGTGATIFYTVSKTNTQFFNDILPSAESFSAGDEIYVEYEDDGQNAADVAILLTFKADPV